MPRFRIGEYFEIKWGRETPHQESWIEANSLSEAKDKARERYGWGAWAIVDLQYGGNQKVDLNEVTDADSSTR